MRYGIYEPNGRVLSVISTSGEIEGISLEAYPGCNVIEMPMGDDSTHYVVDTILVLFPPRPSRNHSFDFDLRQWQDSRSLEEVKLEKRAEINLAREAFIDAPLETPYGVFDSDPKARTSITDSVLLVQTMQSLGTPISIDFTLFDNSMVTLDTMGMITVGLLLGQKVQAAHARSRLLKAQIDGASIEELSAIQWNSQP